MVDYFPKKCLVFFVYVSLFSSVYSQTSPYYFNQCDCYEAPCETQVCYGRGLVLGGLLVGAGAGALTGWAASYHHHSKSEERNVCCTRCDEKEVLTFHFCLDFQVCTIYSQVLTTITPYVMQPNGEVLLGETLETALQPSVWTPLLIQNQIVIHHPVQGVYHLGYYLSRDDVMISNGYQSSSCSSNNCSLPNCLEQSGSIQTSLCSSSLLVSRQKSAESQALIFSLESLIGQFFQCPDQQLEVAEYVFSYSNYKNRCDCRN